MAQRVPITVRLESFEGPLDLLLYLIQSHELDISKVSISKITDQYLAYVRLMQELNFDTASEFLVMAATLLHWKSKALLPQEQKADAAAAAEEEFTQEDLIRQLLEHQRFLAAGQDLAQLPRLGEDVFTRNNRKPPIEKVWKEMSLTDLTLTYQDMLVRARKRTTVLRKETVSLTDKILEFRHRLEVGKLVEMRNVIAILGSKPETVVTFLASLELSRLKKMRLHQEGTYQPIFLELLEQLTDFNMQLASGFDNPDAKPAEGALSGAISQVESAIAEQQQHDQPGITQGQI
ncbi:MAG: segregation/condensation protein A [Oligoflexia bacterium]|nr:segregation/condensation protein A [Oligoflexia bacterium]